MLIDDAGAVRILVMNRPDKRNALNMALSEALIEALGAAESAAGVRAVLLTGAGPAFCAGADLRSLQRSRPPTKPWSNAAPN